MEHLQFTLEAIFELLTPLFKTGLVFCCLTPQASGLATVNEAEKVIVP